MMKISKKGKLLAAIFSIVFIVYNVVLFVICKFSGHNSGFWISWVFMLISFAALAAAGILLGKKGIFRRDWLFGFPIIKHSTIYIILEFVASTVFMIFDGRINGAWAFSVQFILLGIYLVFAISCILAKETIDDVQTKVKDKTTYIKLLKADAEMLCEKCNDAEAKKVFVSFAEAVRYSDIMSSEVLFELEKDIQSAVTESNNCLDSGDTSGAVEWCKKANILLTERNKKTKALK